MTGVSEIVADRSVRIAWAADADAIGSVQARAWLRSYATILPQAVLDQIDGAGFASAWREAVTKPPSARHRVLVALDHGRVVGFAATAPSDDPDGEPFDGEIVALHIDPAEHRGGHGSRLVAAAVDTMRADGFTHARMWIISGDDDVRSFIESAGWGPDGAHRVLDLTGDGSASVKQVRLHTDLREDTSDSDPDSTESAED